MKGEIISSPETKKSGDSLFVYGQLLGLAEKYYPTVEELPEHIVLRPEILGSLEESILTSDRTGVHLSQSVWWNKKQRRFTPGKVIWGTENETRQLSLIDTGKFYFGRKPLFYYHTHPWGYNEFSYYDFAIFVAWPQFGFIFTVGSVKGCSFLFQTERSAKIPFSSRVQQHIELARLEIRPGVDAKAHYLNYLQERGLGLYTWSPPGVTLKTGDMKNRIMVTRQL